MGQGRSSNFILTSYEPGPAASLEEKPWRPAGKFGKSVAYTYFPMVTGFVRNTLAAHKCDVIIGYPQGDELVQNTNPYYRTAYTLIYKPDNGLDGLATLTDPRLKDKRIGVVAGTPPATIMARNGLLAKAKPYALMIDTRFSSSSEAMLADLKSGEIDVGALWGADGGLLRREVEGAAYRRAVAARKEGLAHGLPDHHGCPRIRPGVEAHAQPAHPRQSARDRQDPP
jgi:hypothetical protein